MGMFTSAVTAFTIAAPLGVVGTDLQASRCGCRSVRIRARTVLPQRRPSLPYRPERGWRPYETRGDPPTILQTWGRVRKEDHGGHCGSVAPSGASLATQAEVGLAR